MAKIPLATGQEQITTQAPVVRQTGGLFSTAIAQASQEFAQTSAIVAQQFEEAQTLAEKTKADTGATRKLNELLFEANEKRTIEDITAFKSEYKDRIGKIREEATKAITLPQAKNEFSRTFDSSAIMFDFNIRKSLQTNQNQALEVILNDNLTTQRDVYINGTPEMQHMAKTKRSMLLNEAFQRGIITANEARTKNETMNEEWPQAKIDADIEKDAEYALAQLQLGEKGLFSDVEPGIRNTKMATATERINRDIAIAKRNLEIRQHKDENAMTQKYLEKELTSKEVNDAEVKGLFGQEGGISKDFAIVMRRAIESSVEAKPTTLESIIKFNELVERNAAMARKEKSWLNMGKVPFEDIARFRADIINANAKGYITDTQTKDLLSETSQTFYREPVFQNALNQIAAQSKLYATSEVQARVKAEMYGNLITKVIGGKEPRQAVQEVIQERLNTELGEAIKVVEEEGRIFAKKGNQRIYSDDGGITWKDEKTDEEIK